MYSKDNPQSILNLIHWRSEFIKHAGNAPLLIACNKSDLSDAISDEALELANENGYQVNHYNQKCTQAKISLKSIRNGLRVAIARD